VSTPRCFAISNSPTNDHITALGRYINFFGQREARLSADQSVFDGKERKNKRTWLIRSTSILLLFAPEAHLKGTIHFPQVYTKLLRVTLKTELETVYIDFVILKHK
jgi:hypothetical protein